MVKRFNPVEGRNAEIIEAVMSSPEVSGLNEDLQFKIRLCVEEVEENILAYSGTTWVEVSVDNDGSYVVIKFQDGGVAFDPLYKEDPDITASLEQRQVGGLGIFLCKQIMDKLEYRFENNCNMFTMTAKING